MKSFVQKHASLVIGTLSGFDRVRFRGTLRQLSHVEGFSSYLAVVGVLLKDFRRHVEAISGRIRRGALEWGDRHGLQRIHLRSSRQSKEELVQRLIAERKLEQGPVALLSCVEPCRAFSVRKNGASRKLELRFEQRQCLHVYAYQIHPECGLMHARLQTWFPFALHVCINGREWLGRQMQREGLGYLKRDNCFVWLEDPARAQELATSQLKTSWSDLLGAIGREINPELKDALGKFRCDYYWSVSESEWATDVMFRDSTALQGIYRPLLHHAIQTFGCDDVLRFLGRRSVPQGRVPKRFENELRTDLRQRTEGIRLKHVLGVNSLKCYDKQGSLLRVETTINEPRDFRVQRPKAATGELARQPMRKGIADIFRRAQVSQGTNERFLEKCACVADTTPLSELVAPLTRPTRWRGRGVRGLRPWSDQDTALLQAIVRSEFAIRGFRNREIRELLYPNAPVHEQTKLAARVTRKLRMLRAHGLIRKLPKSYRYQLTPKGQLAITGLLSARAADINALTKIAA